MAEIEIDDEIYEALNVPEGERDATVRTELAVSLYDRGVLSFGKARALADLSKREFHRLLGDRRIERHYTEAELDEDVEYARR
jgi:predicted HTH domain antitoxin